MFRSMSLPRLLQAIGPSTKFAPTPPVLTIGLRHTAIFSRGIGDASARPEKRRTYTNRNGEEIIFRNQYPPPGCTFVPSGNAFVTRQCRVLAKEAGEKIYACYTSRTTKKAASQYGLYVPNGISEKVRVLWNEKKAELEEKFSQKLNKAYPHMPAKDKNEVRERCSSTYSITFNKALIWQYVLHHYTDFESHRFWNPEDDDGMKKARDEAEKILSKWRGEDVGT
ncbi:hypothetical protein B0I35DRAFT_441047 [Stachybotrys elegans]|uniref:Uncharacterized protein n=1 Tax=Stachybotrys elegans TaxID=80388 RepID=A0A8K0SLJ3_9HYPO|nr:hypothetical protein B0I35DRAFT_441047 [Stachybotrys elegans]